MDFVKNLLGEKSSELIATLTGKAGFSMEQARTFVPEAAGSVVETLQSHSEIDLSNVSGAAKDVVDKLDVTALAQKTGVDVSQASRGLAAIVPGLLQLLQEKAGSLGNIQSLLSGLGDKGIGGMLGGVGKMFGK